MVVVTTVVEVVVKSVVEVDSEESDATDVVAGAAVSESSEVDCCHTNQAPTARIPTTAAIAIPIRSGRLLDAAEGGSGGVVGGGGAAAGAGGGGGG